MQDPRKNVQPEVERIRILAGADHWRGNIPVRMGFLGENLCYRLLFLHEAPHIQHNGAFFIGRSALQAPLDRASELAIGNLALDEKFFVASR